MSDEVLVERRGAVQVITINRPQAKNALNLGVAQGVAAAVDELDASDELRVGVLTGAGGVFSAGMDLKGFLRGRDRRSGRRRLTDAGVHAGWTCGTAPALRTRVHSRAASTTNAAKVSGCPADTGSSARRRASMS